MSESTQEHREAIADFEYGGITLSAAPSQVLPLASSVPLCGSYNPAPETWDGLGYSAFARRY